MLQIGHERIGLRVSSDGQQIHIEDRKRTVNWRVDTNAWGYVTKPMIEVFTNSVPYAFTAFSPGQAVKVSDRRIDITYPLPDGQARFSWILLEDALEVVLNAKSKQVQGLSHPGSFLPDQGAAQMLIPHQQGLLLRNTGPVEHHQYTMDRYATLSMLGYLTAGGGLLACQEDVRDRFLWCGKTESNIYSYFGVTPCEVEGWYQRTARIYPTEESITALCKRYRRRLVERGMFVSWERKIARKPIVEKLFGSLLAFIGYNQGRQTDYVANARRLRQMGFESVFYYPVRFNLWVRGIKMGGDDPINLTDEQIHAIQETGGTVAPWSYTYDAADTGQGDIQALFALDPQGRKCLGWKMDNMEYNRVCTAFQTEFIRRQFEGPLRPAGWIHYDVSAIRGGACCCNTEHAHHRGRTLTAREDQLEVGRLLGPEVSGNRAVSSEGFNEYAAQFCDLGSNKWLPNWGDQQLIPVPLTLLIFHDSIIHNWWEIHVYNDLSRHKAKYSGVETLAGQPEKRAAMDALYGCPPLVYPFGRQFGWAKEVWGETYSYEVSLDEPEVQRALRAALPVTKLHKKIGKCEMLSFDFVTDDFAVQTTTFSDGTRVVANISDQEKRTEAFGTLAANTWKVLS